METPTITPSDVLAAEIADGIVALAKLITRLEQPHYSNASQVRGARTVSNDFIISMIAMVEARPEIAALGTFDVDEAREMMQFNGAFRHVADRVDALLTSIVYTMESWKADVVRDALRTYAIAKALARDPDSGNLINHVDTLRRDLGRTSGHAPSELLDPVEARARDADGDVPPPLRVAADAEPGQAEAGADAAAAQ